jgi:toxin HigB-1
VIRNFKHRGLQRLFERDDRGRIRPDLVAKVQRVLARLDVAVDPTDMTRRDLGCMR